DMSSSASQSGARGMEHADIEPGIDYAEQGKEPSIRRPCGERRRKRLAPWLSPGKAELMRIITGAVHLRVLLAALVAGLLLLPLLATGSIETGAGQPAAAQDDADANRPSSRQLEKRFQRARELLAEANSVEATRLLQSILDSDEDDFFQPDGGQAAGEK